MKNKSNPYAAFEEASRKIPGMRASAHQQPEADQPEADQPDPPFIDLRPWLDGSATPELPTIAPYANTALFYAGRLNAIHGEPGHGKTNILLSACAVDLKRGGRVLYIDPEDTPRGFATRARLLGIAPEDITERIHYLHCPEFEDIRATHRWAVEAKPSLVILDGLAEAMAGYGADEDNAQQTLQFLKSYLRPFCETGAAVVIADHVTKNSDNRGRFARGSGAKLGRYDGAVYAVELGKAYSPTVPGFVRLKVAKDRNGGVGPVGSTPAEIHFAPSAIDETTIVEIRQAEQQGPWKPTVLMEKIVEHLRVHPRAKKRELRPLGRAPYVDKAIEILLEEGVITFKTEGQSHVYSLAAAPEQ